MSDPSGDGGGGLKRSAYQTLLAANDRSIDHAKRKREEESAALASAGAEIDGPGFLDTLYSVLMNLPLRLNGQDDPNTLEVEIRLGTIVQGCRRACPKQRKAVGIPIDETARQTHGSRFRAGVDNTYLKNLRRRFNREHFDVLPLPPQRLLCSATGDRVEVSSNGNVLRSERKEKRSTVDILMPAHQYDLRVCCSVETPDNDMTTRSINVSDPHWEVERIKRRTSYLPKGQGRILRIDITEVTVTYLPHHPSRAGQREKEFELEFELDHSLLESKFGMSYLKPGISEGDREAAARFICTQLMHLLEFCMPPCPTMPGICEPKPIIHILPEISNALMHMNGILKSSSQPPNRIEFLGSMPVNMYRSSLDNVLSMDYFLTEKSDGTRYLLYVVDSGREGKPICLLMDRARNLFAMPGSKVLGEALGIGTVVDGEMVYNITMKKSVFLVFDLLMYRNKNLCHLPFESRLSVINKELIPNTDQFVSRHVAAHPPGSINPTNGEVEDEVMPVIRKLFFRKQDIDQLLKSIKDHGNEKIYHDSKRHHFTDGIIFQPNTPYVFSRYYDLLKWKFPELVSVDVTITIKVNDEIILGPGAATLSAYGGRKPIDFSLRKDINESHVFLNCAGPEGHPVSVSSRGHYNVGFTASDTLRLLADIEQHLLLQAVAQKPMHSVITEVHYDISAGHWVYSKIRGDKSEPNYIDTVLGVFTEQAEAITLSELEYTLIGSALGLQNDYDRLMTKMSTELLEWQRARKNTSAKRPLLGK